MFVFGDLEQTEAPQRALSSLARDAAELDGLPVGDLRHGRAARFLIFAGEIAQGLLDASFKERGADAAGRVPELAGRLVFEAARALARSDRGERDLGASSARAIIEQLARARLPEEVTVRVPEGYAFYAVYPELYLKAAEALSREVPEAAGGRLFVLGIRSAGTSLAAAVAAGASSALPPITLRPVGHPFQRVVSVAPSLTRRILDRGRERFYAIADEGPGLSGSSFGAVADWLEDHGVAPSRIAFFPSHKGEPGARASERHRARYERARRCLVELDSWFVPRLASIIEGCVGERVASIEDISWGQWREKLYQDPREWPPVCPYLERRKFLATAGGEALLAKFAGLGRSGDWILARARRLGEAGLAPRARGLARGLLISDWVTARPLPRNFNRARLVEAAGRYIGFLAKELPARRRGATPESLLEMARFNAEEALGPELASALDRFAPSLPALTAAERPVYTDNKMHRWEWLDLPDGRLLKADALEHHAGHDRIGPQDPAWDIEGASIELDLDEQEEEALREVIARASGYRASPLQRQFYRAAYLTFQIGFYTIAAMIDGGHGAPERARLSGALAAYTSRLRRLLAQT